jgi:hypothetical protein
MIDTYIGLHVVKYPLFLSYFMILEFSYLIFEKYSNINFHEYPSLGNRVVPCGQTDMKLIVAFRNSANALKNQNKICAVVTVKFIL